MNAHDILPLRMTSKEVGHPQPATPIRTDNNTADGIINGTFQQNRSKAIDMRFYWLIDRAKQGQFSIYWARGETNLADYFTKHHPGSHHRRVRPIYTTTKHSPTSLQGCIDLLTRPTHGDGLQHKFKKKPNNSSQPANAHNCINRNIVSIEQTHESNKN